MDVRSHITLNSGNPMPVLGLGTWMLTNDTPGAIARAIGLGYRMIDTAEDYGTQPGIGAALRQAGIGRDEIYIVTKVEEDEDAYEATKRDLEELGVDHADLMLIHRPPGNGAGEALWDGLIRAREEGLTRDIGVSNYTIAQIDALIEATGEVPAVNQIEWSPLGHSDDMPREATARDIIIQAYSPLTRARRLNDPTITDMARRYGKSPAQILIRWNLQRHTVPLPKANRESHMEENIHVFDFEIVDEDMQALGALNEHYSALGGKLQYE